MVRWMTQSRHRASGKRNDWLKGLIVAGAVACSATVNALGEQKFMVAAANPHAVDAGYDILAQGGTAADAALAVQTVLNLVEPQSSGIGGGVFILYWDASTSTLHTIDGRETAPASATPGRFSTLTASSAGGTLLSADSRSVYPALSAPSKSRISCLVDSPGQRVSTEPLSYRRTDSSLAAFVQFHQLRQTSKSV